MFSSIQSRVILGAAIVVLLIVLIVIHKVRKKKREYRENAQMRRRDQALIDALENPHLEKKDNVHGTPVDAVWNDKMDGAGSRKQQMIELEEFSDYSSRKYIFSADKVIRIGSDRGNQLELVGDGVAPTHCEIFLHEKKPCVRSLGREKTILCRGKNTAPVSKSGTYLRSGDVIKMGSAKIRFRLFKG